MLDKESPKQSIGTKHSKKEGVFVRMLCLGAREERGGAKSQRLLKTPNCELRIFSCEARKVLLE